MYGIRLTTTQKAALLASAHYILGTLLVAGADALSTSFTRNGGALVTDPTAFALLVVLVGYGTHAAHAYASKLVAQDAAKADTGTAAVVAEDTPKG